MLIFLLVFGIFFCQCSFTQQLEVIQVGSTSMTARCTIHFNRSNGISIRVHIQSAHHSLLHNETVTALGSSRITLTLRYLMPNTVYNLTVNICERRNVCIQEVLSNIATLPEAPRNVTLCNTLQQHAEVCWDDDEANLYNYALHCRENYMTYSQNCSIEATSGLRCKIFLCYRSAYLCSLEKCGISVQCVRSEPILLENFPARDCYNGRVVVRTVHVSSVRSTLIRLRWHTSHTSSQDFSAQLRIIGEYRQEYIPLIKCEFDHNHTVTCNAENVEPNRIYRFTVYICERTGVCFESEIKNVITPPEAPLAVTFRRLTPDSLAATWTLSTTYPGDYRYNIVCRDGQNTVSYACPQRANTDKLCAAPLQVSGYPYCALERCGLADLCARSSWRFVRSCLISTPNVRSLELSSTNFRVNFSATRIHSLFIDAYFIRVFRGVSEIIKCSIIQNRLITCSSELLQGNEVYLLQFYICGDFHTCEQFVTFDMQTPNEELEEAVIIFAPANMVNVKNQITGVGSSVTNIYVSHEILRRISYANCAKLSDILYNCIIDYFPPVGMCSILAYMTRDRGVIQSVYSINFHFSGPTSASTC